jgi:peptide/nickel transport system ATP-binding protein
MLELDAVRIAYGRHEAVRGVDLLVHAGQTVGLVGESGSGKSSVAKAVVGLNALDGGQIRLDGTTIARAGRRVHHPARIGLQMVFQDPRSSLNPRMRVRETLDESVRLAGATGTGIATRVGELMSRIGMDEDLLDRFPHQLSGGQLQRIAIARALAVSPNHLVLDEVTASLDVSVQARILNLLRELQAELGFSMLYISHDLSVVRYLSDYVYVMREGSVVEHGPTTRLFDEPSTDYTRLLLDSVPELDGTRWRTGAADPIEVAPRTISHQRKALQ